MPSAECIFFFVLQGATASAPLARPMKLPYGVARQYGRCARDVVERASRRRPLSSSTLTSSIDSNNNSSSSRNGQQAQSAAADAIGDGWMEGLTRHERKRLLRRGPVGYVTVGQQKQLREEWGKALLSLSLVRAPGFCNRRLVYCPDQ